MYLRNGVMKALKVKNVLLAIAGVFFLFAGIVVGLGLIIEYIDDINTALQAKAMPGAIDWVLMGAVFLIVVAISRKLMGDARFYSSYFEGSLDGFIRFKDLAAVTGRPAFWVACQLSFFRLIYMKKYSFVKIEGEKQIELYSKKALCECKNCGAPIDKRIYFTGICSYCGSSDLFAKVLSGDKFYSISSDVKSGFNRPAFYRTKSIDIKDNLYRVLLIVGLGVAAICGFMVADSISKYNDKDYIQKEILDATNNIYSKAQVRDNLNTLILFGSLLGVILLILAVRRIFQLIYVSEARADSVFFAKSKKPFLSKEEIPWIKTKENKKMRHIRGALRNGYLANCTLEMHEDAMKVVLAKKIVKDTCPSCASPITGAVDENYVCQVCGNKIMGVIEKK